MALAESFRRQLISAARKGEGFDTETGLPESMVRKLRDVSFFTHAMEFAASAWKAVCGEEPRVHRRNALPGWYRLSSATWPALPTLTVLRGGAAQDPQPGEHAGALTDEEVKAVAWLEKASRPMSAFEDAAIVCDVLDALAVNLDGRPAAPEYFSRRRRVLHKMLGYAVRKKRLNKNPLSKDNLPEGWTPPEQPDDARGSAGRGKPSADRRDAYRLQPRRHAPRPPVSSRSTPACTTQ